MKNLINFSKKVLQNILYGIPAAITTGAFLIKSAYCGDEDLGIAVPSVTITVKDDLDGKALSNDIINLFCGMIVFIGIIMIALGYGTYAQGHGDDNSTEETKGVRKMVTGVVLVGAPVIVKFLFTGKT